VHPETVLDAAKRLAELDVGAMPICGNDNRLKGMLTDRDIVVKVLAQGKDPSSVKASRARSTRSRWASWWRRFRPRRDQRPRRHRHAQQLRAPY
jgi:CBS-domain-containing membrane protein